MPSQKRILLCIYTFPPLGGARALRWLNLVKGLYQRGWEVDVLTVQPSTHDSFYDESLLKGWPSKVKIFRTYPGIYYSLLHFKQRPIRGFPKTTIEWLPFGLKKGLHLVRSHQYSVIISSALPFVGHLLGYLLSRKTKIPWVADYGDSLGFNPLTSRTKRMIGGFIESQILKDVHGIIVPFEEMKQEFIEFYPFLREKNIKAIGHGISEEFDTIRPHSFEKKFVMTHIGSFYKDAHEPFQFFQALASLIKEKKEKAQNIEVVIAGNTEPRFIRRVNQLNLKDSIKFAGQLPYDKAISLLKGSSVTLYIGGKRNDYHFPSKVVHLTASGRPILAIRQSVYDLGSDFIEKNNLGIIVPNRKSHIAKAIQVMMSQWKNQSLEKSFSRLPKHSLLWQTRIKELEEFLFFLLNSN